MQIIYCSGQSAQYQGEFGKIAVISEEHGSHALDVLSQDATINQISYLAMRESLIVANVGDEIRSDSQLVVGQLTKGWAVNAESLKALHAECAKIYAEKKVKVVWVRRQDNLAGQLLERLKGRSMFDDVNYNHVRTTQERIDEIDGQIPQRGKAPFDPEKAFQERYVRERYPDEAGAEAEVSSGS